jgi:hypothetical protein
MSTTTQVSWFKVTTSDHVYEQNSTEPHEAAPPKFGKLSRTDCTDKTLDQVDRRRDDECILVVIPTSP